MIALSIRDWLRALWFTLSGITYRSRTVSMKLFARLALVGVVCLAVAIAVVSQFAGSGWWREILPWGQRTAPGHVDQNTQFESHPDPNAPGTSKRISLGGVPFDDDI